MRGRGAACVLRSYSDTLGHMQAPGKQEPSAWRPSKVAEERLSSISSTRPRRRFSMPPAARLLFTSVLFVCGAYFFLRLWLTPEAGQLHPELAIAAIALALLFVFAMAGALVRRRRKHGDDKSILRL